ncbi:AAA family ATPase, partial [Candidatus Poribacteria bacterium]|nr:AAA family ATPase [Candidatus Poribacteria bacterium]
MLTRIQAKGYKSFRSVDIHVKPFTVIVGPNNAGKSNLFDLLGLISGVAQKPLEQAFAAHRGDAIESFYLAKPDINLKKRKRRKNPFLEIARENGEQFLKVVPERGGKPRQFPLGSQRSVMTVIDDVEFYPTLCAV